MPKRYENKTKKEKNISSHSPTVVYTLLPFAFPFVFLLVPIIFYSFQSISKYNFLSYMQ